MSGGLVPGTAVPADFELSGTRHEEGWDGCFVWPAIGFQAEFALERWLLGEPVAQSRIQVKPLLAELRDASLSGTSSLHATFFPSWLFSIDRRNGLSFNTAAGDLSPDDLQLQLLRPGNTLGVLKTHDRPLTRFFASGVIEHPVSVGTEEGCAIFGKSPVQVAVEMQRDDQARLRHGIVLESAAGHDAGRIVPTALSGTMRGFGAHSIRVSLATDAPTHVEAELATRSCWYEVEGLHFEVLSLSGAFRSCPSIKGAQTSGNLLVARLIAPMAGVDDAVFLRRSCVVTASGCVGNGSIVRSEEVDGLKWIDSHPLRLPVDEFELRVSKGGSALSAAVAFTDFDLEVTAHAARLQGRSAQSALEFILAPQHVAEEAVLRSELPQYGGHLPSSQLRVAKARFAGPSWITFGVNADRHGKREIGFSAEELFDWDKTDEHGQPRLQLKVHPLAVNSRLELAKQLGLRNIHNVPPGRIGGQPGSTQVGLGSLIQAPYRLGLSPLDPLTKSERIRWRTRGVKAVKEGQLAELWSVRAERLEMRAVWSPDYNESFWPAGVCHDGKPFLTSLDGRDRHEIVALTARFGQPALMGSAQVVPDPRTGGQSENGIFVPQPVRADIVLLSSFGATLRLKGRWAPPAAPTNLSGALTVQLWDQASQLGRDTKVVVEYKGFLLPVGHPATLIKETERRLVYDAKVGIVARLVQRYYIRVTALIRQLPALEQPFEGRGWPFGNLAIPNFVSPDLEHPSGSEVLQGRSQQAFWPRVANANGQWVDFPFTDSVTGVEASAPMVFVDNDVVHTPDLLLNVITHYRNELEQRRNQDGKANPAEYRSLLTDGDASRPQRYVARVRSGKIRFAPTDKPEKTSFKILTFLLDVDIPRPAPKQSDAANPASANCADKVQYPPVQTFSEKVITASAQVDTLALEEAAATPGVTPDFLQALRMSAALEGQNQPPFYPHLRQALLEPTQLAVLTGGGRSSALVEIDAVYLAGGFDSCNAGEIYLRFADSKARFAVSGDTTRSGGFANTTTIFSAVSRIRGPIGGAGPPLPQPPGYRYKPSCRPPTGMRMLVTAPVSDDPVGKTRAGGFDPREYFANSLGDVKLGGVVSFVDIVDAVLTVSGARAPQIIQQLEHELNQEIVHPIAGALADRLTQAAAKLDGVPYLQAPVQSLAEQMRHASQAVDSELASTGTALVSAINDLRDRVHTAIEDPRVLLPPDALSVIDKFLQVSAALRKLQDPHERAQILNALLGNLGQLVQEQALVQLTVFLDQHPDVVALAQRLRDIETALGDLKRDLTKDPQSLIVSLPTRLAALLDAVLGSRVWSLWLDKRIAELRSQALRYAVILVRELKPSVPMVLSAARELRAQVDTLKAYLDGKLTSATVAQAQQIKQAFLELSDIALAATAHAAELDKALAGLPDSFQDSGLDPRSVEPIFRVVRGLFDCLAKVPRLRSRVHELLKAKPQQLPDDTILKAYGTWVAAVAGGPLPKIFQQINSEIGTALRSSALDALAREGLEEFQAQVLVAFDVAKQIAKAGTALDQLRDDLNYALLSDSVALIAAALNAQDAVRQAVQRAQLAGKQAIVTALAKACGQLATVMQDVQKAVSDAQQSTSSPGVVQTVSHWLSPSIRARLASVAQDIGTLAHAPNPDEDSVRKYLGRLDALTDDASKLVNELGRIAKSGDVGALVDVRAALDEALDKIGLPTSVSISYDWETEVNQYPGGAGAIFIPHGERQLKIHSHAKVDLRPGGSASASIEASLDKFAINLFGSSSFLIILFKGLKFEAGTGKSAKLTADVDTVTFGQELEFVRTMQQWLQEKTGILVDLWDEGPGVVVGYQFNYDIRNCTAFTLQNIGFNISAVLPFNSQPARFRFGLSTPEKPFLLSVGIYGGGGFFRIQARADTIEYLEASFEYGLVTAFKFGPASGSGRITAGVYIRLGGRNAKIAGFFNASGNADIAGLITISANFRVVIWYEPDSGRVAGQATFSVSFSIGFLSFSFSVDVGYSRQGDGKATSPSNTASPPTTSPDPLGWDDRALLASTTPLLAIAQAQGTTTDVGKMKAQIAHGIPPDNSHGGEPDVSRELLRPELWRKYWSAFEETLDECA